MFNLAKLDQALTDFDSVLKAQPDNERALRYRAYIYAAQKQDAKAVEDLTKLIEKNPSDPLSYKARADANAAQSKWSDAIADYSKALELNPERPRIGFGSSNRLFAYRRQRQRIVRSERGARDKAGQSGIPEIARAGSTTRRTSLTRRLSITQRQSN